MSSPIIVSIVNHKGGVLKTTVTANLGAGLARAGKKVLLVDLDAQQNLTTCFMEPIDLETETALAEKKGEDFITLLDALLNEMSLDDLICETSTPGLDIIPCAEDFCSVDLSLAAALGRELKLKKCFAQTEALESYDFVLLDNPPNISLVVANSLIASDYFLIPCASDYLPMTGLKLLGNTIGQIQDLAPQLRPLGVVLTMYTRNERMSRQVESLLRAELKTNLFDTKIRPNTKGKSAPSKKLSIFDYEKSSRGRGTEDFTALTEEFLERLGLKEEIKTAVND